MNVNEKTVNIACPECDVVSSVDVAIVTYGHQITERKLKKGEECSVCGTSFAEHDNIDS